MATDIDWLVTIPGCDSQAKVGAVCDGRIYGTRFCLSLASGEIIWNRSKKPRHSANRIVGVEDGIIVATYDTNSGPIYYSTGIYRIGIDTGELLGYFDDPERPRRSIFDFFVVGRTDAPRFIRNGKIVTSERFLLDLKSGEIIDRVPSTDQILTPSQSREKELCEAGRLKVGDVSTLHLGSPDLPITLSFGYDNKRSIPKTLHFTDAAGALVWQFAIANQGTLRTLPICDVALRQSGVYLIVSDRGEVNPTKGGPLFQACSYTLYWINLATGNLTMRSNISDRPVTDCRFGDSDEKNLLMQFHDGKFFYVQRHRLDDRIA